ncbi:MAG: hypothetical protein JNL98_15025 [Bryobacterales bacterium]|nr:hypothetical protein [Bryobacterales bacterium]
MKNSSASAAKLAANLENAQKSTGPRTEEGKEKVSHNARKHGLSGARFYCPAHLEPLLDEIEEMYRAEIRPRGFLEEDAFLLLRNARFNMERAQILMDNLSREAESRGADPLADPTTRKDYLLYQRYFNQANSTFQRYLRQIRLLQNERLLRAQIDGDTKLLPGLASITASVRLLKSTPNGCRTAPKPASPSSKPQIQPSTKQSQFTPRLHNI